VLLERLVVAQLVSKLLNRLLLERLVVAQLVSKLLSRVLLERLVVAQLVSKNRAIYGTRSFIIVFTGVCPEPD
jgi:hypothetical protein